VRGPQVRSQKHKKLRLLKALWDACERPKLGLNLPER
jgi:hypothetical protein